MPEPFIGEIRMFGGNFAPAGWAFCSGQIIPISQNDALFTLIGITYGGDGQETFALPDLQSRVPIHMGQGPGISQNYLIGERAGVESVTLTAQQVPVHTHAFLASGSGGNSNSPTNNTIGSGSNIDVLYEDNTSQQFNPNAISAVGGSQPHDNMQPFLVVSFIISLYGIFPRFS